jgi:hypothetical protein
VVLLAVGAVAVVSLGLCHGFFVFPRARHKSAFASKVSSPSDSGGLGRWMPYLLGVAYSQGPGFQMSPKPLGGSGAPLRRDTPAQSLCERYYLAERA